MVFQWVVLQIVVFVVDLQSFIGDCEVCICCEVFCYGVLVCGVWCFGIEFCGGGINYEVCGFQICGYIGQFELNCLQVCDWCVKLVMFFGIVDGLFQGDCCCVQRVCIYVYVFVIQVCYGDFKVLVFFVDVVFYRYFIVFENYLSGRLRILVYFFFLSIEIQIGGVFFDDKIRDFLWIVVFGFYYVDIDIGQIVV